MDLRFTWLSGMCMGRPGWPTGRAEPKNELARMVQAEFIQECIWNSKF